MVRVRLNFDQISSFPTSFTRLFELPSPKTWNPHSVLVLGNPAPYLEFLRAGILDYIVVCILKDVVRAFIFKRNLNFYAQWLSKLFTHPTALRYPQCC